MTTATYRTARAEDLALMAEWAAAEGWNPGLEDAAPFHGADPQGFFLAEVEGAPVACISVVNHAPDFAFLGFYICKQAFRGQGIGMGLWTHALGHAGTRTVGLDGVAAQEANYVRSGFTRQGMTRRMSGQLEGQGDPAIRSVTPVDLPQILGLDRAACGYDRAAFLTGWLTETEARRSLIAPEAQAFVTIRGCREGVKIGPVVAPDPETALRLIRAALAALPAEPVFIDITPQSPLGAVLESLGFVETFAAARMYRGPAPKGDGRLMAVASMELG
ncbi:Acetyltransferase (GNAT) family protein [Pseudooceanicola antarcticus]|uniref:Acetyltransferase (GNAT) family protein n=1 Tax=Pseudooceanicola antarcticus TaxID=1247613 RepID=A0A285J0C5_9RHOB|nr:GNAT family N-acetyltransferase [Pseudooceanicola antarcticus]PJE25657.1 N-acetyltransferase [Pseudooceanicola antarcticus]SNY53357.1 Acetyltransferase (GNAT) family protein [Pseudooceanicola antarcticus]